MDEKIKNDEKNVMLAGILSLAATRKLVEKNKKIVCLVSGGNIDVKSISSMINKGLVSRGRIFTFNVPLANRPGQLEKIVSILADLNANIISLDHNLYKNLNEFNQVELTVTVETNGEAHIRSLFDAFSQERIYITRMR